jgi:predicted N-acetyltransferase YhbS
MSSLLCGHRSFRVLLSIVASNEQENEPQQRRTLSLPNGKDVPFRVIRPEDAPALQRVHTRCSGRTIYLRFFGSLEELPDKKAQHFASVDGVDRFCLVALDPEDQNEIIAVVRFDREPGNERAEYAALVEDRWQEQGVGAALTRQLIDAARDKGVRFFYALVKGQNTRMLNVLRHLDLPEQERQQGDTKSVEVELPT